MGHKLMIFMVSALVIFIDARSLEPSNCHFKKFLLSYYGVCQIDQTETEACLDLCSGEPVLEEDNCKDKLECCWDGQQCSFKQIPVPETEIENQQKLLRRVRRQSNSLSTSVLRLPNNLWRVNGAYSHNFPSGGTLSASGSYTQGTGSTLGLQYSNRGLGGQVNYNSQSSSPLSYGLNYNTNLWNGRLNANVNHSPGGSPSFGLSYSKSFGR